MSTSDDATPEREIAPPEHVPAVSAEDLVVGEDGEVVEEVPDEPEGRKYPSTIGGAFYLAVLGVVFVGMVLVALAQWRTGIRVFGCALLFAALVRLVLKPYDAGMLAVRNKAIDAGLLIGLGVLLIFLASSIPDPL